MVLPKLKVCVQTKNVTRERATGDHCITKPFSHSLFTFGIPDVLALFEAEAIFFIGALT